MLLALWPAIIAHSQWISAGREHETVTQRAIRAKEIAKRKAAIQATIAQRRLPEADDGTSDAGRTSSAVALPSVPDSNQSVGNATIRIPRHERTLAARLPEALGASLAAGYAVSSGLDAAMNAYAAQQAADEDDEMVMIIILAGA